MYLARQVPHLVPLVGGIGSSKQVFSTPISYRVSFSCIALDLKIVNCLPYMNIVI